MAMYGYQQVTMERPVGLGLAVLPILLMLVVGVGAWLSGSQMDGPAVGLLVLTTVLAIVIFRRAVRNEPDSAMIFQVLVFAWLVKLASMAAKLYLVYAFYGGSADAVGYHQAGIDVSTMLLNGQLPDLEHFWGTQFIENATGLLYVFTTPTFIGGWIVWSFLGTMGALFYYKAFVTAVPAGARRWYLALVFFAPSVVIWTNSLGKDALMCFFVGMSAYGAARIARQGMALGALFWTGAGVAGTFLVRPHLAALVSVALAAVAILRPIRAGVFTPFIRFATIAAIGVAAFYVVQSAASFIGVEDVSVEGVTDFLEGQQEGSQTGGAAFEASFPTNPQGFLLAVVTVLFRPFPWEAGNILAMASALESVALIALMIRRFRSLAGAARSIRRNAYIAFSAVYILMFIFFFSAISNFGILARQRVQLLPFIFIWVAFLGSEADAAYARSLEEVRR